MKRKQLENFSITELIAIAKTCGDNREAAVYTIIQSNYSGKIKALLEILICSVSYKDTKQIISYLSKSDFSSNEEVLLKVELPKLIIETENPNLGKLLLELLEKTYKTISEGNSKFSDELFSIHKRAALSGIRYLAFMLFVKKGYFTESIYTVSFP